MLLFGTSFLELVQLLLCFTELVFVFALLLLLVLLWYVLVVIGGLLLVLLSQGLWLKNAVFSRKGYIKVINIDMVL
jgi:hypothetical protein